MNCIILDDEKPAIKLLSTFVKRVPFLQLVLATNNAFEALEKINKEHIDLLFLDIEMPDLTGIEFLKSLDKKPAVIFTTAYEQYAFAGFELDIVDYLLKPIPFDRFLKAANKAHTLHQANKQSLPSSKSDFLVVKSEYKNVKILLDDILYIEGLKDYVKIFTGKDMILTRLNLKGIEQKLPSDQFIRIHRSYIIALSKISSFSKSQIIISKKNIPIGEAYRENVLSKIT